MIIARSYLGLPLALALGCGKAEPAPQIDEEPMVQEQTDEKVAPKDEPEPSPTKERLPPLVDLKQGQVRFAGEPVGPLPAIFPRPTDLAIPDDLAKAMEAYRLKAERAGEEVDGAYRIHAEGTLPMAVLKSIFHTATHRGFSSATVEVGKRRIAVTTRGLPSSSNSIAVLAESNTEGRVFFPHAKSKPFVADVPLDARLTSVLMGFGRKAPQKRPLKRSEDPSVTLHVPHDMPFERFGKILTAVDDALAAGTVHPSRCRSSNA